MDSRDKAIQTILKGGTPERKIMSSAFNPDKDEFIKKEREKEAEAKKLREEKSEILRQARTPWFCPEEDCGRVMGKRLDDKMYRIHGKCFECVLKEENEHRLNGTWDQYEKKKVLLNKKAWLTEQIQGIHEWKKKTDVTFLNQPNPDGHSVEEEKWSNTNSERVVQLADEAIANYTTQIEELETKISEL